MTTCCRIRVLSVIIASVASVAFSGIIGQLTWGAGAARGDQAVSDAKASEQKETENDTPPASEELIAAALNAGTITYEESLRQRAFAIYGDPRVEPHFRSSVIDWEAGRPLFAEIDQKEATLSKELLDDLAPFRARPNDPISIFNRPRSGKTGARRADEVGWVRRVATGTPAQSKCTVIKKLAENWESELVPQTNVRAWIPKAYKSELGRYKGMVWEVWRAFPAYFTYPLPDNGNPCDETNPDSAVDIYFVRGSTVDPRSIECRTQPGLRECTTNSYEAGGMAQKTPSKSVGRYSGYALVNVEDHTGHQVYNLIAHELAHTSQFAYDAFDYSWLFESTATWVEYKVMKALEKEPGPYQFLTRGTRDLNPLFPYLHDSLHAESFKYAAWLFFYSASIDLGDNVVKDVWEKARGPDRNGIFAVNEAIPLIKHFARYAVRNWNRDLVPEQWRYRNETRDKTFPTDPKPEPPAAVKVHRFDRPGTRELTEPVQSLAARYYTFTFADSIRTVTFQNLLVDWPDAHIWAIQEVGGQWKEPEDWTKEKEKVLCRDIPDENVTKLILVMSNSHITAPLPPHPLPRVVAEAAGCQEVFGWAKATLRVKDDLKDVTYVSSRVNLRFKPRDRDLSYEKPNREYDLLPTAVTWTATGTTVDGCTISGQILVTIPSFLNQPLDPSRPAYGYLNVVGLEHGDFHSVWVSATGPEAFFTKTCPGDPPTVTTHAFEGGWLLHILWEKNIFDGSTAVYKGKKEHDFRKLDVMNLLPPGAQLPQIALDALAQTSADPGSLLYTWEWELKPLPGTTPASPPPP